MRDDHADMFVRNGSIEAIKDWFQVTRAVLLGRGPRSATLLADRKNELRLIARYPGECARSLGEISERSPDFPGPFPLL